MDADKFLTISLKSVKSALFIRESILQSPPQLHYQKKFSFTFLMRQASLICRDSFLELGLRDPNPKPGIIIYPPCRVMLKQSGHIKKVFNLTL